MIIVTTLLCLVGMIVLIGIIVVMDVRDKDQRSNDVKYLCVHHKRGYCKLTHEPCEVCALFKTEDEQNNNQA